MPKVSFLTGRYDEIYHINPLKVGSKVKNKRYEMRRTLEKRNRKLRSLEDYLKSEKILNNDEYLCHVDKKKGELRISLIEEIGEVFEIDFNLDIVS